MNSKKNAHVSVQNDDSGKIISLMVPFLVTSFIFFLSTPIMILLPLGIDDISIFGHNFGNLPPLQLRSSFFSPIMVFPSFPSNSLYNDIPVKFLIIFPVSLTTAVDTAKKNEGTYTDWKRKKQRS